MRLVSFSVEKYRSIKKTQRLELFSLTTLVGPNNEGKSNLLHAVVTVLQLLPDIERLKLLGLPARPSLARRSRAYIWDRDFPVDLQAEEPDGQSTFNLEFVLEPSELTSFRAAVKSNLNGTLPISVSVGKGAPSFKVKKKGPGGTALSKKSDLIARFVGSRFQFEYIPPIRDAQVALNTIRGLLISELGKLSDFDDFRTALRQIRDLQAPALHQISQALTATARDFLPSIREIRVRLSDEDLQRQLARSFEIIVDDGLATSLERKGDGVQSLVALGLLKYMSERSASGKSLILAIEEPESHLHPGAVHALRRVLGEISNHNQVVLTTHSPVFVNRTQIAANILVATNKAAPARSTPELRESLGIRASDNLRNAEVTLLVEGETDRTCLLSVLSHQSPKLKSAISAGTLAIDTMNGGSNLTYKLSQLRDSLGRVHCFLDHDDAGRTAIDRAHQEGLLDTVNCTVASCEGMADSEIEDLYSVDLYEDHLTSKFGVTLKSPASKRQRGKWSERMRRIFVQQGKPWNDRQLQALKALVSELAAAKPDIAINEHRQPIVNSLIEALVQKIEAQTS
jgi:hypothetical protein